MAERWRITNVVVRVPHPPAAERGAYGFIGTTWPGGLRAYRDGGTPFHLPSPAVLLHTFAAARVCDTYATRASQAGALLHWLVAGAATAVPGITHFTPHCHLPVEHVPTRATTGAWVLPLPLLFRLNDLLPQRRLSDYCQHHTRYIPCRRRPHTPWP